jgi:hypothetical protein
MRINIIEIIMERERERERERVGEQEKEKGAERGLPSRISPFLEERQQLVRL